MGKWCRGGLIASAPSPNSEKFRRATRDTFLRMDDQLKKLARYLQPFFLEPPPDPRSAALGGWLELLRVGKRFRGISGDEIAQLVSFFTGSLGDFLDRHYESEKMKTMFLANNVYGKHGGPYDAGSALGLLFHLLSGGDGEIQGFYGHVIGGMGAITQALASACRKSGAEILTSAPVAKVDARDGRARGVSSRTARRFPRASCCRTRIPSALFSVWWKRASCPPIFATRWPASRWTAPAPK